MRYYGEKLARNEELPHIDAQEDTIQLGGNFTVDCQTQKLIFYYPSRTPTDRPSLSTILKY